MSPSTPPPCTHERRPGTTVCLRCRHEARIARRRRALGRSLKAGAVALTLAAVGAAATSGAEVLQGRQLFATRVGGAAELQAAAAPPVTATDSTVGNGELTPADSAPEVAAAEDAPTPTVPAATTPIVREGRTELGDGLFAVRDGGSVTVSFDVPQARTRRRDKFDRIVRATLPSVYGRAAQSALDAVPAGQIVAVGTLPAELESSGLRLPIGDGRSIELWPELRDAEGGPLVVGYRAVVER